MQHFPTDEEIIRSIQAGEGNRNFRLLFDRYHGKVLDKCYSFVKNRRVAEDLTEDIMSRAFEKLPGFRFRSAFSSWLYAITYNHCIDYLREKKRLHYPQWNRENELPEIIDESYESMNDIDYDKVMIILEQIHPEEKALIWMKYHDNLSLREIGNSLRISEDAAKMRLKRAKARVLYLYRERFPEN